MTEQTQNSIALLVQELNVSEDLARIAVNEADGVLEKARDILSDLLPKYIIIKARFLTVRSDSCGGLIFICVEKNARDFIFIKTIQDFDRDWLRGISVYYSPEIFDRFFIEYFQDQRRSIRRYDAQKLKDSLKDSINPTSFNFLFKYWNQSKQEIFNEKDPRLPPEHPVSVLKTAFEFTLSNILVQDVEVEVDYDFLTSSQFEAVRESLGVPSPDKDKSPSDTSNEKDSPQERFRLYLKGQFIIDPVDGVLLEEVQLNDVLYCEILDRSEVAVSAGRIIGAYRRGAWFPVRGTVVEIDDMTGERRKYRLKIAPGIYVDVLSFTGFRVRAKPYSTEETFQRIKETNQNIYIIPFLIAMIITFMIMFSVLLTR